MVTLVDVGRSGVVQLQLSLAVAGAQGRVCLLSLLVGQSEAPAGNSSVTVRLSIWRCN